MPKFCSDDCQDTGSICDFCTWYDFNGNEDGAYIGDGWCRKFEEQADPSDGHNCDEFICFRVMSREESRNGGN